MTTQPVPSFATLQASGIGDAIRAAVPPWLVPLVVGVTWLGNVVFFLALFTGDYWLGDRTRGAHALALALGGMVLVTTLKAIFAEPRPPESWQLIAAESYGFPSGHATMATIGYGLLASEYERGTRRLRYAVAAVLIVAVALSRVALGVHFVRDVVAGVATGGGFLLVASLVTDRKPGRAFSLAAAIVVVALVVSGASQESLVEAGAILGAGGAWVVVRRWPALDQRADRRLLVGAGVPVLAALSAVSLGGFVPLAGLVVLNVLILAGVILAPALAGRYGSAATG